MNASRLCASQEGFSWLAYAKVAQPAVRDIFWGGAQCAIGLHLEGGEPANEAQLMAPGNFSQSAQPADHR